MSRRFTRTREDFTCLHCATSVAGDGYTNHCPVCLWSRHVDVHPGDRAADCRAPMEPINVVYERGRYVIIHFCTGCTECRRCRAASDDDVSAWLDDRPG